MYGRHSAPLTSRAWMRDCQDPIEMSLALPIKPRPVCERQFRLCWIGSADSHLITLHRRGSGLVIRVDCARWGQTPEDLRHLALSAPHARTRERALALFDITQHRCAT